MNAAASFADANGGTILNLTDIQALESSASGVSLSKVQSAIQSASSDFAASASGQVHVFQGPIVDLQSVWAQVEYPALSQNPNVIGIIYHVVP